MNFLVVIQIIAKLNIEEKGSAKDFKSEMAVAVKILDAQYEVKNENGKYAETKN